MILKRRAFFQTLVALAAVAATEASAEETDLYCSVALADLGRECNFSSFRSDRYIDLAIALQRLPPAERARTLQALAGPGRPWMRVVDERSVFVLCRMLFQPPFRAPGVGVYQLPDLSWGDRTRNGGSWSLLPIEIVDRIPFWIAPGISGDGYPESVAEYVRYCLRFCDWSTTRYAPVDPQAKAAALRKLIDSPRWQHPLDERCRSLLAAQVGLPAHR